ncbi:site-specific recombinase XerD [Methanomethylovorans hollandica DSM 15978]|uniref:Site-specific recombinase XerD n=1 Tax=Methanomethylovorans hollandica (strain DSM 15978 / NBRC 107637 / DMS1) TaxID=867904 RepID=L0KZQ6_METHD|nr:tyrosine-type recombinase/integrase [Methanomethylovorans hollandica]AGB49474.1 site-specific recombinase XerD [Methanomethylovorans hollandica DSM 15978]
MDKAELAEDLAVQEWKRSISPAPTTWASYCQILLQYCRWTQKTPSEMLEEAERERNLQRRLQTHRAELLRYKEYLEEQGKAPKTVRKFIDVMRSFYNTFDINVNVGKLKRAAPREEHTKIPSIEDIRKVLEVVGPLERALLLVGCSSGLGANEITNLKISQFREGYDSETGLAMLYIRREKAQYDHVTFLSPEASRAVQQYLAWRDVPPISKNKDVVAAYQKRRTTDDGYLFVKGHIPAAYLETQDEELRKYSRTSFAEVYREMQHIIESKKGAGQWGLIRSHNMRKVFYSALINAGCDSMIAEYFMGHTLDATRTAYFRASPDKLRDLYIQYVPALTIQEAVDLESSEEYQRMKDENQAYAATKGKDSLKVDMALSEVERLEREIHALKAWVEVRDIITQAKLRKSK